jgi:hypothetical protein
MNIIIIIVIMIIITYKYDHHTPLFVKSTLFFFLCVLMSRFVENLLRLRITATT